MMDLTEEIVRWFTPLTDYVPAIEAERLHADLIARDPEGLAAWLWSNAPLIIADRARGFRSHRRAVIQRRAGAHDFAAAATTGTLWEISYRVSVDNAQRSLGLMTAADHLFVADDYQRTSTEAGLLAAFHREVARKLGGRLTRDVFTEETLTALRDSIIR